MVVTIFFTSAFWLIVELILLSYTNVELSQADINQFPDSRRTASITFESSEASIEEFKSVYVTLIPPNPRGPGESGEAVHNDQDDPAQISQEKEGYKKYSFNELASSKISLERSIPDNRPEK